ncbi:MAG: hypothetical protein AB7L90_09720 [Hyphomicrobiaceae bacterium]
MTDPHSQGSEVANLGGPFSHRVLAVTGVVSALAMIAAASLRQASAVTASATIFAIVASAVAVVWYRQAMRQPRSAEATPLPAAGALLHGSRLAAICYAWGAVAMQGLYLTPLTGLKWQHGWQYALVMALLATASVGFGRSLPGAPNGGSPARWATRFRWAVPLAGAQACVAGVGLAALLASGKLVSTRADWAANRVFAGLAVAVFAVSVASILIFLNLKPSSNAG